MDPVGWLWFALCAASVWLFLKHRARWAWVCGAVAVVWWVVEYTALPTRLLMGLETRIPAGAGPWDAVVVLGGGWAPAVGLPLGIEASDAFDRLLAGVEVARTGRADQLWLAGAAGRTNGPTDGECARDWILRWGLLPAGKVVVLPPSRNTREEAARTAERVRASGGRVLRLGVATSAWHMPRALGLFRGAAPTVGALPADYPASVALARRAEVGPNWFPRQGSLQHFYLWLSEVVGRWRNAGAEAAGKAAG